MLCHSAPRYRPRLSARSSSSRRSPRRSTGLCAAGSQLGCACVRVPPELPSLTLSACATLLLLAAPALKPASVGGCRRRRRHLGGLGWGGGPTGRENKPPCFPQSLRFQLFRVYLSAVLFSIAPSLYIRAIGCQKFARCMESDALQRFRSITSEVE